LGGGDIHKVHNSNSLKEFSNLHEELGIVLKTMTVGLVLCEEALSRGETSKQLWKKLDAKNMRWGTMPQISQPGISAGKIQVGNLGAVQGFSAFDTYMDSIRGELESYNHKFKHEEPDERDLDDDRDNSNQSLSKLYKWSGFDNSAISFVLPVYYYFQSARNCIVHRCGLASKNLQKLCESDELERSLENWKLNTGEHGDLRIKKFKKEEKIEFDYSDAILTSSTLRLIALDIDRQAVGEFRRDGLVYLAAKKMLKDCNRGEFITSNKTASDSIAYHVGHVNRVLGFKGRDAASLLKRLDLLADCNLAYDEYMKERK